MSWRDAPEVGAGWAGAPLADERKTFDPTADMSTTQRVLAGVGKAMTDVGRGAGQMLGLVSRKDIEDARALDAPLMNTTAGKVGNIGGSLAMLAPTALIPGANTLTGAGLIGATTGALQPSTSTSETLANIGLGGAGGVGGQALANKLGSLLRAGTLQTQAQQQSAAGGKALGFEMTPGQVTGSRSLQRVEAALESNPMTSRPFDMLRDRNTRRINEIAAKAIGEKADNLGADVLGRAEARMGSVFDKVADGTPVPLDPQVVGGRLRQILDDSEGLIGGNASLADNALFKRLDSFVNEAGGATREQLRTLSSKLGKAARNNMTTANGDRELGSALFEMKRVVDEQVMASLKGPAKQEFGDTMRQYSTLMQLTARNNVVNPSNGNVSPRALASLLQQKDKGGFTFGGNQSDLYGAARFAQAFPEVVGNSGTATRSMGAADYLASLPLSLASRAYLSAPASMLFNGASGGTNAALGLLSRPEATRPLGILGGLGGAGGLLSYLGEQ